MWNPRPVQQLVIVDPTPPAGFWQWSNTYASWQAGRDQSGEEVEKFDYFKKSPYKTILNRTEM